MLTIKISLSIYSYVYQKKRNMLEEVFNLTRRSLTQEKLAQLLGYISAILHNCKTEKDGCGLKSGSLIDSLLTEYLTKNVPYCEAFHNSESDLRILNHNVSVKKITGKSTIALDWSKNPENSLHKREYFQEDMMIVNTLSGQWWKKSPKLVRHSIDFTTNIPAGIFFVSKDFCKANVRFMSNNKTNTLIEPQDLYLLLSESIRTNLFIEFPDEYAKYKWNVLEGMQLVDDKK